MQLHFNISYFIPVYFPLIPFENEISGLDTPHVSAVLLWQTKTTNYQKWFLNLANTTTYVWSYTFFINVIQTKVRHSSFSQTIETCNPPPPKNACLSNNPLGCSKYKNSSILTLKLISRKIRNCVPTPLKDYLKKKKKGNLRDLTENLLWGCSIQETQGQTHRAPGNRHRRHMGWASILLRSLAAQVSKLKVFNHKKLLMKSMHILLRILAAVCTNPFNQFRLPSGIFWSFQNKIKTVLKETAQYIKVRMFCPT